MEFTVAITGASGSIYAHRTLLHMIASGVVERINLIMSESAETVARVELGVDLRGADAARINEWLGLPPEFKTDPIAAAGQSGRQTRFGIASSGRHGGRALLNGHARSNSRRPEHESDSSRGRRHSQRASPARAGAARNAI